MNENIREEYIQKFKETVFETISQEFRMEWARCIGKSANTILGLIKRQLKAMFQEFIKLQVIQPIVVGCVEISLLRTSFYFGTPQICIEIYDHKQALGNCVMEARLNMPVLTDVWKNYYEKLEKESSAVEWARFITKEVLYQFMQEEIGIMATGFAFLMKYQMEECHEWKELQDLVKTDPFYISAGQYRDWQKLVFVQREPFDIFLQGFEDSLRYGRFTKQIYYQKDLYKMDLKGSYFNACEFHQSTFGRSSLEDCTFVGCKFVNATFTRVSMPGVAFLECTFHNCTFENVEWTREYDFSAEEIDDCYRTTNLSDSKFLGCNLTSQDLKGCCLKGALIEAANLEA